MNFTNSNPNPELEKALDGAQTAADLREITLRTLAAQGQIFRTQDEFDIRIQSDAAARPVPLSASPASEPTCYRVIYPSGNDRYELTGESEEELNAKEQRIRQMFGGQR